MSPRKTETVHGYSADNLLFGAAASYLAGNLWNHRRLLSFDEAIPGVRYATNGHLGGKVGCLVLTN
jgi:hypothetical protein